MWLIVIGGRFIYAYSLRGTPLAKVIILLWCYDDKGNNDINCQPASS